SFPTAGVAGGPAAAPLESLHLQRPSLPGRCTGGDLLPARQFAAGTDAALHGTRRPALLSPGGGRDPYGAGRLFHLSVGARTHRDVGRRTDRRRPLCLFGLSHRLSTVADGHPAHGHLAAPDSLVVAAGF